MKKLIFSALAAAVFFLLFSGTVELYGQPAWSPENCLKLKNVSGAVASPDGQKVLYTIREAVMTDDRSEYINQVWVCNSDGSQHQQLTRGDRNSSNPQWSPDGKWISFTSSRDGKANLYLLPVAGGESEKITEVKTGVGNYEWSRDGRMIAFLMMDAAPEKEEKNKKAKNDWYYMDEEVRQNRLYVLWLDKKDSTGKKAMKVITPAGRNVSAFDWNADGTQIVYSWGKSPEANDNVYSDIDLADIATATSTPIAHSGANEISPLFSPDGKLIAYYATADPVDWSGPRHAQIYSLADHKSWSLAATPNEDGGIGSAAIIAWTPDGKGVLWGEPNHTLNSIYLLGIDGKSRTEWSTGITQFLTSPVLNSTGSTLSFILQSPSAFPEVYVSKLDRFAPVRLTSLYAGDSRPLPRTELIKWKGADGKEIEGLLTYPINYQPGTKVPFILNVHGGPAGVFQQSCVAGNSGTYPIATLAEMGYAILRPNPRGSSGYGAAFRMANRGDWGGKDFIDIMAGVDEVIKKGVADESKMGVMGWSYGGFMSSWIVGHTNRFKAASIGAPVVDLSFQNLTDDIEGFLPSYFQTEPWNNWGLYDAHSPLRFVQNVQTPVMLQHCEGDQRVPIGNGIMFYNALRRRNVPVRMLVMPRQAHGPVEPTMVLKTMQSNVEWFEKYIGAKKSF